jgi:hypothetical protein
MIPWSVLGTELDKNCEMQGIWFYIIDEYSPFITMIRKNQELIKELSIPPPDYQDLSFPTKYSQNFYGQCIANFWKQYRSYWKNPPYNAMRYLMTFLYGLVFGTVFWQKGKNMYGSSYFDAVFETKIV